MNTSSIQNNNNKIIVEQVVIDNLLNVKKFKRNTEDLDFKKWQASIQLNVNN